ncbi:hypothetical protein LTR93_010766 [Exophiala xenobiotica]|nr:hypothetical protein LTR93_010766 [Exophiala xenobiotica]
MYVSSKARINRAQDVRGKKVGIPEYKPVWQRGIVEDDFGVPVAGVEFYAGAVEHSETKEKAKFHTGYLKGRQWILPRKANTSFPASRKWKADYFEGPGIFPIMYVVAIKLAVYNADSWIAKDFTIAFALALEIAYEPLKERAALRYMMPWLESHVEETKQLIGGDPRWWKDGFKENRRVLDKSLDYHHQQELSKSLLSKDCCRILQKQRLLAQAEPISVHRGFVAFSTFDLISALKVAVCSDDPLSFARLSFRRSSFLMLYSSVLPVLLYDLDPSEGHHISLPGQIER